MKGLTSALPVFVLKVTSTHFIFKCCNSLVILRGIVTEIVSFSDRNIDPFPLPRVSDFFRTSRVFPGVYRIGHLFYSVLKCNMNTVKLFCIIICIVTIIGSYYVGL